MAYVTEEIITNARTGLKSLNKEYGVKSTLKGKGTSSLTLSISKGSIDFITDYCATIAVKRINQDISTAINYAKLKQYIAVNQYYLENEFSGLALEYMQKASNIMHAEHWDKSDIQSDYFNCAYYVNIYVGRWNKPYALVKK